MGDRMGQVDIILRENKGKRSFGCMALGPV